MKQSTRRLAAIMFTDMVGYTKLMQENEQKAREYRDRHRSVLTDVVARFDGKILQHYGDGTLSTFGSAISAVRASVNIQTELRKDPPIPLRIGVHVGDILDEEDAILGDGVNVASRIQSLAVPGAVFVSEKVYDEIKNQEDLPSVFLGEYELKNVQRPLEVYAITAQGLKVPDPAEVGAGAARKQKTIAVLPFVNMSADAENEYFSDGISEEIINALTKIDGLLVTSRTSSFAFKGKHKDVREIGRELKVGTVLEGSVRKSGGKVRVTAQLINTDNGFHAWSEVYDRKLEDVFVVQDEISRTIAEKLRLQLSGRQAGIAAPSSFDAYDLYLKALSYWNKWTPSDALKAIELLEQATKLDPGFSLAYAQQAFSYTYLGALGQLTPHKAFPIAKQLTAKAFELQGSLAEAYLARGLIALFYDWTWKEAEANIRRALEISPGSAIAHHLNGLYLSVMGRTDEEIQEEELAHRLDPLSLLINYSLGGAYFHARRFADALRQFQETLLIDPTFRAAKNDMAWIYFEMGEKDRAIDLLEKTRLEIGDELKGWTQLGYIYAKAGRIEDAKTCLEKTLQRRQRDPEAELSIDLAVIYEGLGDLDSTFKCLNEAIDNRVGGVVFLNSHLGWDILRSDSRFKLLLRRLGFET